MIKSADKGIGKSNLNSGWSSVRTFQGSTITKSSPATTKKMQGSLAHQYLFHIKRAPAYLKASNTA